MPEPVYDYQFDPDANLVGNLIPDEHHTVTAVNADEYHIVVPRYAPYYLDNFELRVGENPTPLVEGVDYLHGWQFTQATINTAKVVYGAIILLNKNLAGTVRLHYRTVGGMWTLSEQLYNELLNNVLVNPRHTTWEQVAATPQIFPVIEHIHVDDEDMTGLGELVEAVDGITAAIQSNMAAQLVINKQTIPVVCGDETTPITADANIITFRWMVPFILEKVAASLTTAQVSGTIFTVDVLVNGLSILSTKITIDNGAKTSLTAVVQSVLSSTALAEDDEITISVLAVGSGEAAGLKVYFVGTPNVA